MVKEKQITSLIIKLLVSYFDLANKLCINKLSMNVSLVSFYGYKPTPLIDLIQKLQTHLLNQELVQSNFVPYELGQIHGTIIGCEGRKTEAGIINKWFEELRQETRYMDFPGLVNYLQHQVKMPKTICFGGYNRTVDYDFLSRGQHLYFRSFQLQPAVEQTIPLLIGWSKKSEGVPSISLAINNLRRDLQQFGMLHKYHGSPENIDNDFYLRLGTISPKLTLEEEQAIATEIRHVLATQPALYLPISLKDLAFAQYQDLSLTPATTKVISAVTMTAGRLEQLYSESVTDNK